MKSLDELRHKVHLKTLLENVTDQQAHKAIRYLIGEAEREFSHAVARGNDDPSR